MFYTWSRGELPGQLCISSATNFEEPRGTKVRERDKPLSNAWYLIITFLCFEEERRVFDASLIFVATSRQCCFPVMPDSIAISHEGEGHVPVTACRGLCAWRRSVSSLFVSLCCAVVFVVVVAVVDVEVLLYFHRNGRLIRDGSPGRPSRLSHSSWTLVFFCRVSPY